ncbi:hypothetical protein CR513_16941, partial [Mucuna pruriens]
MKAFPFSLDGATKDWLYLQLVLFNTCGDMNRISFWNLELQPSRKKYVGSGQHFGETLHEYLERFNKLCTTCPHHQISLTMIDWSMIDAASGGALMDKTPTATRKLFSNMAKPSNRVDVIGEATCCWITPTKRSSHISAKYECHHSRPQDANRISIGSSNLPSQTIPNPRGNASVVTLRSGKALPQLAP